MASRNRMPFRMYMPNKPGKYGINVKTLAGADVPYVYSADVYAGKPAEVKVYFIVRDWK